MGYVPPSEADKRYALAGASGPTGPTGSAGPTGPTGPAGSGGLDQATADDLYVNVSGDTVTGQLQIGDSVFLYEDAGTGHVDISGALMVDTILAANGAFSVDAEGDVSATSLVAYQATFSGGLNAGNARVTGVGTPQGTGDATPRSYVDARTPKITVATTAPGSPAVGDIWVDTN